jgi:hypothetical protein
MSDLFRSSPPSQFRVSVTTEAENGKANTAVLELLAYFFVFSCHWSVSSYAFCKASIAFRPPALP